MRARIDEMGILVWYWEKTEMRGHVDRCLRELCIVLCGIVTTRANKDLVARKLLYGEFEY